MRSLLPLLLILCMPEILLARVIPYLSFRSQGTNLARELVGWQQTINRHDMDSLNWSFSITPEYTRSFWGSYMAEYLFDDSLAEDYKYHHCPGSCATQSTIRIQGTKADHRYPNAWMAENFYLPPDFSSIVSFDPVISNALVDINWFCGLDMVYPGLYVRVHSPLVYTQWDLGMHECVLTSGIDNYDPGYASPNYHGDASNPTVYGVSRYAMLPTFTDYVTHCGTLMDQSIYAMPLRYARMSTQALTKTRLAEITAVFGINPWTNDDYHAGINIRAAAPTGNIPDGTWLFEPIVGQGHHWEFGMGITSHWCLGRGCYDDCAVNLYVDAYITHLFPVCQRRTFDICGDKPMSRYMLACAYVNNENSPLRVTEQYATMPYQYTGICSPVANLTTIPVMVSAAAQGEVVATLTYNEGPFQFDLGYNLWGRSCEEIEPVRRHRKRSSFWSLKGDSFVYGFPSAQDSPMPVQYATGMPLSATQTKATIFYGTNNWPAGLPVNGVSLAWNQNPGVDNLATAADKAEQPLLTHAIGSHQDDGEALWQRVGTSNPPVFIDAHSLAIDQGTCTGMTQKIFMHINYTWTSCGQHTAYVGFGAECEFADHNDACEINGCSTPCCQSSACKGASCCSQQTVPCVQDQCFPCALSQWGVWLKGGISI